MTTISPHKNIVYITELGFLRTQETKIIIILCATGGSREESTIKESLIDKQVRSAHEFKITNVTDYSFVMFQFLNWLRGYGNDKMALFVGQLLILFMMMQ